MNNLGLHFDPNLRFKMHVTKFVQKVYAYLKMAYPNRYLLSISLKLVADSLVLNQFNHCDVVHGPFLEIFTN